MNDYTKILYDSVNNYFDILSKIGYISDRKVYQLLLLLFLEEFIEEYSNFITSDDLNLIDQIVYCITETNCFVPYADNHIKLTSPVLHASDDQDITYVFAFNNNIEQADAMDSGIKIYGNPKNNKITLNVGISHASIIILTKHDGLTFKYNLIGFPVTKIQSGQWYQYVSMNTYSNQDLTLEIL